jgi:hypothetical protein
MRWFADGAFGFAVVEWLNMQLWLPMLASGESVFPCPSESFWPSRLLRDHDLGRSMPPLVFQDGVIPDDLSSKKINSIMLSFPKFSS